MSGSGSNPTASHATTNLEFCEEKPGLMGNERCKADSRKSARRNLGESFSELV